MEVLVNAKGLPQKGGVWLLEDHLSWTRHQEAITARAIVTPRNRVITQLINLTSAPLALHKGTKVAVLSQLPITSIQSVVSHRCTTFHITDEKRALIWELAQQSVNLSPTQRDQLYSLLLSYDDLFAIDDSELGQKGIIQHKIDTVDALPVHTPL